MTNSALIEDDDRANEVKKFDESKIGVKGLVDSGVAAIPTFFRHPPETLATLIPAAARHDPDLIPAIDLSGDRASVVDQVRRAAAEFGFFQVVNHGVPQSVLDRLIGAVRGFHEQPTEIKARIYRREATTGVSFFSNVDLFKSKAASWRDTIQVRLGAAAADPDQIPSICREEILGWDREVGRLGDALMGLLSEGLGLGAGKLTEMSCLGGRVMVGHYYPHCPEPDQTVGIAAHTDPGIITVLLQNQMGGLQIKYGEEWVDLKPLPGALVINVGDLLQILSNDVYKSVDHRVLANPSQEARVSVAVFLNPSNRDDLYGPLPELLAPENPARYRNFTVSEFLRRFFTKELDGNSLRNYFKLQGA